MLRFSSALVVALTCAGTAPAASWADGMFTQLSHDFGTVPRGTQVMYTFRVANTTGQAVHIESVRVSCNCVSAAMTRNELAPGEEAVLVARIDTRRFNGYTAKTIFVTFDRPELAEVRLAVSANSREDLSITPEALAFGQVDLGGRSQTNVVVTAAGHGALEITNVASDSTFIQPKLSLVHRDAGEASYRLTADLRSGLPAGTWYSTVWLTTNDAAMPRIAVPVTVEIASRPAEKR